MNPMEINADQLDSESRDRISALGHISITPEAKDLMDASEIEVTDLFERYVKGDYGSEIPFEQRWENDVHMFKRNGQVQAIYQTPSGRRLSITTTWCKVLTEIEEVE